MVHLQIHFVTGTVVSLVFFVLGDFCFVGFVCVLVWFGWAFFQLIKSLHSDDGSLSDPPTASC